mmetsp:Transcript_9287/g.16300  ORF Transcript_9287/g.16300 Transcript_9287/m.16300 type:complete len:132 (-) Transcript_9287:238-633(-)
MYPIKQKPMKPVPVASKWSERIPPFRLAVTKPNAATRNKPPCNKTLSREKEPREVGSHVTGGAVTPAHVVTHTSSKPQINGSTNPKPIGNTKVERYTVATATNPTNPVIHDGPPNRCLNRPSPVLLVTHVL